MRTYGCTCGNTLFYDNSMCLACGSEVGFCPGCRQIVALVADTAGYRCSNSACGVALTKCANYAHHQVCNRCVVSAPTISPTDNVAAPINQPAVVPAGSTGALVDSIAAQAPLCDCCRFNVTIPDLTIDGNLQKWYRLEAAKRRLFYDLGELGLPYGTAADGINPPLAFDFKADLIPKASFWRTVARAEKVFTGHANGRITINIREADDVEREKLRVDMGEAHRTLIGHFRHEIGHYYWEMLVQNRREPACIAVFGDHNSPTYAEALERHYKNGPPPDWAINYISAYASMHPWEDFAETWAAYLDMVSALDTAEHADFGGQFEPTPRDFDSMIRRYQQLGIALNEMNRTMGLIDVVPEVFVAPVVEKMRWIHDLVQQGRAENGILQPPAASANSGVVASQAPVVNAAPQLAETAPA